MTPSALHSTVHSWTSFSSYIQTCDSTIFMLRNESGQSKGQLQTRQTLALQLCIPSHLRPVWITVHPISITFTKAVFGTLLGCFGFGLVVTCITLIGHEVAKDGLFGRFVKKNKKNTTARLLVLEVKQHSSVGIESGYRYCIPVTIVDLHSIQDLVSALASASFASRRFRRFSWSLRANEDILHLKGLFR